MCTLAGQLSAATCRWLLLIGELDRRKAYENCLTLCAFHHRLVHDGGWRIDGDSAESSNLTFIGPHGRTVDEIGERPRPATGQLPVDPRIDADTIATAEGGRCDLDLAITAIASISTYGAPRDFNASPG